MEQAKPGSCTCADNPVISNSRSTQKSRSGENVMVPQKALVSATEAYSNRILYSDSRSVQLRQGGKLLSLGMAYLLKPYPP